MKAERRKKYLVIGSTGHQYVDCVDWETEPLPNLVDYDVIIANVRTLTNNFLKKVSSDKIKLFRNFLIRFLASSGTLIILSDHYKSGKNEKRYPKYYNNYSWCPLDIGIAEEKGNTIEQVTNLYPKYFSYFNDWEYFFYVPSGCLTNELIEGLGKISDYKYEYRIRPYLRNREKRILAGSLHWWTIAKEPSMSKTQTSLGPIALLPLLKNVDPRKAINLLLEDIIEKPQATLAPSWVQKVKMAHIEDIVSQIKFHTKYIKKHQEKIAKLREQKEHLEYYKKLLYAGGSELEEVFKKCLIDLGASVNPARYAEEEYCLIHNKLEYPVETKGNTKSISLTDLRQLIDYLLTYDEKTGKSNKGILLGNAWKNIQINQRDKPGKSIFPSNVIKRAEATNIALVSSVGFFDIFCKFLEKKSLGRKILDCIVSSIGVVNFKKIRK